MNYTTPGVIIKEEPVTGPITGLGTSTAAFIGSAPSSNAPTEVTKVTNWTQFQEKFIGEESISEQHYLVHAIEGFFRNGGTRTYILAVRPDGNGAIDYDTAFEKLTRVDDVNILCVPGEADSGVQGKMLQHCQRMKDRFAILDAASDATKDTMVTHGLSSDLGYGALYYPWISVPKPQGKSGETIWVPPSGHLAGIYARSDAQRGVHKAPANERITGALGVAQTFNEVEIGDLNDKNVNVIRTFANQVRPTVWGARTLSANTAWRYINVRRLMCFIEESLEEGLRWVVFEPNSRSLWKQVTRTIREFLTRVWRSGALFGATPEEAFFIQCDDELNPQGTRDLGELHIKVGVAPVKPAEFVVITINQKVGGSDVTEV